MLPVVSTTKKTSPFAAVGVPAVIVPTFPVMLVEPPTATLPVNEEGVSESAIAGEAKANSADAATLVKSSFRMQLPLRTWWSSVLIALGISRANENFPWIINSLSLRHEPKNSLASVAVKKFDASCGSPVGWVRCAAYRSAISS
jgi:hypothetical protein